MNTNSYTHLHVSMCSHSNLMYQTNHERVFHWNVCIEIGVRHKVTWCGVMLTNTCCVHGELEEEITCSVCVCFVCVWNRVLFWMCVSVLVLTSRMGMCALLAFVHTILTKCSMWTVCLHTHIRYPIGSHNRVVIHLANHYAHSVRSVQSPTWIDNINYYSNSTTHRFINGH